MEFELLVSCISGLNGEPAEDDAGSEITCYLCPVFECKRQFSSKRNLVDHCKGHHDGKKPHSCSFPGCGKSFLRPAHLQIHNRIHTGEKPFACEFAGCGKRWNQKSALKQHIRSHTGEKPFGCNVLGCTKRFSTSSSCKRHIQTHDKVNSLLWMKRKFQAGDCDSSVSDEDNSASSRETSPENSPPQVLVADELCKMTMRFILN